MITVAMSAISGGTLSLLCLVGSVFDFRRAGGAIVAFSVKGSSKCRESAFAMLYKDAAPAELRFSICPFHSHI